MSMCDSLIHFIGSHRFLNRKLRNFLPASSKIKISKDFSLFLDPRDLYGPSYYVMYDKGAAFYHYEEELKADIVQYLPTGSVFFDVGANIGLISFFVKKFHPEAFIYAFEPGKTVSKCLEQTLEFNKVPNFKLIKKGVSEKSGVAEFFIDPKSTGGSSLLRSHFGADKKNIERIDLISLDEFTKEASVVPGFVKIDVEGAEGLVIKGAVELIKNHKPNFIIETDHKKLLENVEFWKETFKGYSFRPIGTKGFKSVDQIESILSAHVKNGVNGLDYLFVPTQYIRES